MLSILSNKPVIGTTDEDFRLDFLYPSREPKYVLDDSIMVIVKKGEEMRPDILSANFFASTQYYDVVLKHNGISNPFSIDEGDVFISAELSDMLSNNSPSGKQKASVESVRQQYVNADKKSKTEARVALIEAKRKEMEQIVALETMKKMTEKAAVPGSLLPPNIAEEGEREITVIGGKVFFGKDVVNGKKECAEPISKSEFLSRLIKTRNK